MTIASNNLSDQITTGYRAEDARPYKGRDVWHVIRNYYTDADPTTQTEFVVAYDDRKIAEAVSVALNFAHGSERHL